MLATSYPSHQLSSPIQQPPLNATIPPSQARSSPFSTYNFTPPPGGTIPPIPFIQKPTAPANHRHYPPAPLPNLLLHEDGQFSTPEKFVPKLLHGYHPASTASPCTPQPGDVVANIAKHGDSMSDYWKLLEVDNASQDVCKPKDWKSSLPGLRQAV